MSGITEYQARPPLVRPGSADVGCGKPVAVVRVLVRERYLGGGGVWRWWERQLADLVGSLLPGPARQGRRHYQDHRAAKAVLRQRRCLASAQADRIAVRHGLGRRAVGEEVHGRGSHRAVRPGFDLVELPAVLDGHEVRVPQRSEGRARIPVLVVDRADLLQPRQGQDAADVMGVADRPDVQGPDRRGEHPDRPDGDRRNRDRFQGIALRADARPDLVIRPTS